MRIFNTYGEALTQQMQDDAYSQCTVALSLNEVNQLLHDKVIYTNFEGHSVIILMEKE